MYILILFVPQSAYRVHSRCAGGRYIGGDKGDSTEHQDGNHQGKWIKGTQSVKPCSNEPGECDRSAQPQYDPDRDHDSRFAQNHGYNPEATGSQSHADSNLIGPASNSIREHTVQAGGG